MTFFTFNILVWYYALHFIYYFCDLNRAESKQLIIITNVFIKIQISIVLRNDKTFEAP